MAAAQSNGVNNQEYSKDILMIGCNNKKCHHDTDRINSALRSRGYTVDRRDIDADCNATVLIQLAGKAICILLISCSHTLVLRPFRDMTNAFKNHNFEKRVIVTGRTFKGTLRNFDRVKLKRSADFEECVHMTMNKITQAKYGSNKVINDYEALGKIDDEQTPSYEEFDQKEGRENLSEETFLKRVPDLGSAETSPDRLSVNCTIEQDTFVQAEMLLSVGGNKGPFVLESFTKPKGKDTNFDPSRIAHEFNRSSGRKLEEISKYVMSIWIPKLKLEDNFLGLIDLLKFDDCRIQTKVIETIKHLQFDNDIKSAKVDQLFQGIHVALQMIEKRPANHSCITKIVPVVLNALSILYLHTLIHYDEESISERLKRERYSQYLRGLEIGNQSVDYCDYLASLKALISTLEECLGKKNCLQMGNWKEALRDECNCKNLRKDIAKMPYMEQYACIFGIVNQLCLNKIPLNLKMTNLFKDLLKSLITRATNKKTEPLLYPILILATQSIVHLFVTLFHEDGFLELTNILILFLDNGKIQQSRRWSLLVEIESLLFHKNTDTAKAVVGFFRNNGCTEVAVRRRSLIYIERLLLTSSLKITQTEPHFAQSLPVPEWHTLDVTLCGNFNAKLNVLLPTQDCLAVGCMNDYKRNADDEVTKRNITSLEVLLHLQTKGCHSNVVRLIAYQVRPLPLFYIVESFPGQNFQAFLLTKRKNRDWLSQAQLETFVAEIVSALGYLHSRNVIHRDLTTTSFSLKTDTTVILTELKIARRVDCGNECTYASDWLCKQVPIRWISPESILEDKYDRQTDIWMLGPLIYEIFSHGCHPYTEMYNIDTDRVLEWVVFQELKPRKWPCIPRGIHDIILSCVQTKPDERTDLDKILHRLNHQLAYDLPPKRSRLSSSFTEDDWYPDIDLRQQKDNEPERGLPTFFVNLKQSKDSPRITYFNIRKSQRTQTSNNLAIKERDLLSSDQPSVQSRATYLHVEEPVTEHYVENIMPRITQHLSKEMLIYCWPPDRRQSIEDQNERKRVVVYKCQKGKRLVDVAATRSFGNPSEPVNEKKYLNIILEMVTFISKLHSANWIHRDICCRSIYMTEPPNPKVFSPRLGRMCHLNTSDMSDDCVLGGLFEDRINWMPVEVLQGYHYKQKNVCQYSKESDVYMLACAIYEFYKILDIHTKDPMASDLESVPFATMSKPELLESLYSGEYPPQPNYCPPWLYDVMVLCWNRERTRRPSIDFVHHKILQRIQHAEENVYATPDEINNGDNGLNGHYEPNNSSDDYPKTDSEYDADGQTTDCSDESPILPSQPKRFPSRPPALPPPRNYGKPQSTENPIYTSDSSNGTQIFIQSRGSCIPPESSDKFENTSEKQLFETNNETSFPRSKDTASIICLPSTTIVSDISEGSDSSSYIDMSLKNPPTSIDTTSSDSETQVKCQVVDFEHRQITQIISPPGSSITNLYTNLPSPDIQQSSAIKKRSSSVNDLAKTQKLSVPPKTQHKLKSKTNQIHDCSTRGKFSCVNSDSSSESSNDTDARRQKPIGKDISKVQNLSYKAGLNHSTLRGSKSTDSIYYENSTTESSYVNNYKDTKVKDLHKSAKRISCINSDSSETSDVESQKSSLTEMKNKDYEDAFTKREGFGFERNSLVINNDDDDDSYLTPVFESVGVDNRGSNLKGSEIWV